MRFKYWTIQVRPTPTNISVIGVGVVVENPVTGAMTHRLADMSKAFPLRHFDSAPAASVLKELDRWLKKEGSKPVALPIGDQYVTSGILDTMAHRWNNLVTVSDHHYFSGEALDAAADFLFDKLINLDSIAEGRSLGREQRVREIQRHVRTVYESREQLGKLVVSRPSLVIDNDITERLNLGVVRGNKIFELNEAFSLHSSNLRNAQTRIESWTFRMSILRSSGAQLRLPDGNTFLEVASDAPIVATLGPAETSEERRVLTSMVRRWDRMGIDHMEVGEIEAHADELSRLAA